MKSKEDDRERGEVKKREREREHGLARPRVLFKLILFAQALNLEMQWENK